MATKTGHKNIETEEERKSREAKEASPMDPKLSDPQQPLASRGEYGHKLSKRAEKMGKEAEQTREEGGMSPLEERKESERWPQGPRAATKSERYGGGVASSSHPGLGRESKEEQEAKKLSRESNEETNELQQSAEDQASDVREAAEERESEKRHGVESQRKSKALPGSEEEESEAA
jgi:hypothetical protein